MLCIIPTGFVMEGGASMKSILHRQAQESYRAERHEENAIVLTRKATTRVGIIMILFGLFLILLGSDLIALVICLLGLVVIADGYLSERIIKQVDKRKRK